MMSLTTALVLTLTFQNNSTNNALQQVNHSHSIHALQPYNIQNTDRYQQKKFNTCQELFDNIDYSSEYLEKSGYPLPDDFITSYVQNNFEAKLNDFHEKGCTKNKYIHSVDRDLVKKLYQDMKK